MSSICSKMISFPRVVLFGDSITQFAFESNGWGTILAGKLARKCDVLNRGLSGYNSRWAKIVLPRLIGKNSDTENTVAVAIFIGANDSSIKEENPQQHIPLEEYVDNLKTMINYLRTVNITQDKIILITPPPLEESAWEKWCLEKGYPLNRCNTTVGEYAKACVQVANSCGVDVLDLWTLMQKENPDFSCYLSDGLHLSAMGNEFVATNLWPLLEKKVSSLPIILPLWDTVSNDHPEECLLGTLD
ncbi:isoamyl acetate-hydrolyzing esterase 1 homolog isoform X2 [Lissotriton helveticus]